MSDLCPCGSGQTYSVCCGRYHQGASAPTAESLMRSRYSAYVLQHADYLRETWHPSTCPATLHFGHDEPRWYHLEILATQDGTVHDVEGRVEFKASWLSRDGKCGTLHEASRFVRENGRWYYLDGRLFPQARGKVGRNEPCPCASGRKFKQCCGSGGV